MPPKHNCVLNRQARKIIYDLTQSMKKEKEEGVKDVDKVYLRGTNATGVSQRTVQQIATEVNISGLLSDSCERKRNNEDIEGKIISRKKMKKLRRIMRRPAKPEQANDRSGEICVNTACPNPLGGKCSYQLCKKCCKNKCYEENLDCPGHRILVQTRRKMAISFQNENKLKNTDNN